jgi:hypothetical protein
LFRRFFELYLKKIGREKQEARIQEGKHLTWVLTRLRERLGEHRVGCLGGEVIILSADGNDILLRF